MIKKERTAGDYALLGFARNKATQLKDSADYLGRNQSKKYTIGNTQVTARGNAMGKYLEIAGEEIPQGFVFHPRYGSFTSKTYYDFTEHGSTANGVSGNYVNGAGWNFSYSNYGLSVSDYPLVNNDHGTKLLTAEKLITTETPADKPYFYEMTEYENYGNIDWRGPKWKTGSEGEKEEARIISWKGPPSRYFSVKTDYGSYYLYEKGEVIGEISFTDWHITGAALATDADGKDWKVITVVRRTSYYSWMWVLVQPYDKMGKYYGTTYGGDDWTRVYEYTGTSGWMVPSTPMFFNSSATEASTMHLNRLWTLAFDINEKTASLTYQDNYAQMAYSCVYTSTPSNFGSPPYAEDDPGNGHNMRTYTASGTGVPVAVDYVEDTKVFATMEYTMSGSLDAQWWPDVDYSNHYITQVEASFTASQQLKVNSTTAAYAFSAHTGTYEHINPEMTMGEIRTHTRTGTKSAIAFMDIRFGTLLVDSWDYDQLAGTESNYSRHLIGEVSKTFNITSRVSYSSPSTIMTTLPEWTLFMQGIWSLTQTFYNHTPGTVQSTINCCAELMYSNQPVGSCAVDRWGNHFYSLVYTNGVYNYLTGDVDGQDNQLLALITQPTYLPNLVHYPILVI